MHFPANHYRLFFALATCVSIAGLFIPLMDNDAAHHANIALHMYLTGDYVSLVDHNGDYLDKPHLHFWLSAGSYHLFGVNEFAYKLPSFLFSIIAIYATYRLGCLLYDKETGILAALVLFTSFSFFLAMGDVRMDAILTACIIFTTWQGVEWVNKKNIGSILLVALGAALGFSTKGHIALLIPALSIFLYILYQKKYSSCYHWHILLFCFTFFIFISPVLYCYYLQFDLHPEKIIRGEAGRSGIAFILWNQNIERISGENFGSDAAGDHFFFFHTYLWTFAPWSILACLAIFNKIKNIKKKNGEWITAGTILAFSMLITFAGFKLPHYLNIILPVSAIMVAGYLVHNKHESFIKKLLILQYFVCSLALILIIFLNRWAFPLTNPWLVAIFILLIILSVYIFIKQKHPYQKLISITVMSFILLFYLLNLNFYPSLLKYQAGNELAFSTQNKIDSKNVYYWPGIYSSSYDFYSGELRKEIDTTNIPSTIPVWIMIQEKNMHELKEKGIPVMEVVSHPDYEITRLDFKFINPQTRNKKLNKLVLVRIK